MTLLSRFLAARRDRLLMRLGCWLVCFSLILGLMLPQQRAEAAVAELTISAVASVAAAYLSACGLNFVTQGMDKTALVNSVQRLIQEYLSTELGGISVLDWLGGIWDVVFTGGKLVMGRLLTNQLMGFAQWVARDYATQVGVNRVFSDKAIKLFDGTEYMVSVPLNDWDVPFYLIFTTNSYALGTEILGIPDAPFSGSSVFAEFVFAPGYSFQICKNIGPTPYRYEVRVSQNGVLGTWRSLGADDVHFLTFVISPNGRIAIAGLVGTELYVFGYHDDFTIPASVVSSVTADLSVDRLKEALKFIPEALAEGVGIALDVGAEKLMDLSQVYNGILDDVLAGTLASTMEAAGEKADEEEKPVVIPDVGELGLPSLGQALTSRFPFSIPWDFFRAVKLLAAPAKAPYFEVDFLKPIEHRVGKWRGSTTVVLDFSQYAIIGQVSRWTSTIGFCLMLASATKRLIWTA